jgi:hypothetical protein
MASTPNGHPGGPIANRLHFDDLLSTVAWRTVDDPALAKNYYSGRVLVLIAGATILILWGVLYFAFLEWKVRYRARASFGATQVVPVIDSFADLVPAGVDSCDWRHAVRETHALLLDVTSSNLLGIEQMRSLREELARAVDRAQAHPATARDELAQVWDTISHRAEFMLRESPSGRRRGYLRPTILALRPEEAASRALQLRDPADHKL